MVAAIDTPDPNATISELQHLGWRLNTILNTHWHTDHIGGNENLVERYGAKDIAPAEVAARCDVDRVVSDGDCVALGSTKFVVMGTGGYTPGHVSYVRQRDGIAFVGDTLFVMGCGRLSSVRAERAPLGHYDVVLNFANCRSLGLANSCPSVLASAPDCARKHVSFVSCKLLTDPCAALALPS